MRIVKIACLVVAVTMVIAGALCEIVQAGYVHQDAESGVIATWQRDDLEAFVILTTDGHLWRFLRQAEQWEDGGSFTVVPVDSLEWIYSKYLITRNGSFWYVAPGGEEWRESQPPWIAGMPEEPSGVLVAPLRQNCPNPFYPSTAIPIITNESITDARISIVDAQGRVVRTVMIGDLGPIRMSVTWDGLDNEGNQLPPGVYFYQLVHTGGASRGMKAVIIK
ncbi:MAG: FlgD immunoglobulin-like domain containing protein [Candidatus Eisenbacteria bacterium]